MSNILIASLEDLDYFLKTAHLSWDDNMQVKTGSLKNGERLSCVKWGDQYFITGTDIVKVILFRLEENGYVVKNMKKFEEGVFSDLRGLKPGEDAVLEGPKSEFLEFLHQFKCIRTKKKQKVFFWTAVNHDKLYKDALDREIKREYSDSKLRFTSFRDFSFEEYVYVDKSLKKKEKEKKIKEEKLLEERTKEDISASALSSLIYQIEQSENNSNVNFTLPSNVNQLQTPPLPQLSQQQLSQQQQTQTQQQQQQQQQQSQESNATNSTIIMQQDETHTLFPSYSALVAAGSLSSSSYNPTKHPNFVNNQYSNVYSSNPFEESKNENYWQPTQSHIVKGNFLFEELKPEVQFSTPSNGHYIETPILNSSNSINTTSTASFQVQGSLHYSPLMTDSDFVATNSDESSRDFKRKTANQLQKELESKRQKVQSL